MLASEDTVAAAAAYRVEVTILGVVDLLAEAGVGCPGSGGSHRSAYRRFNQCGGGAASRSRGWAARGCQRGMVVKAAGCAGQGILILAWLETRDHFNPFALRASEDFPVDVDRPT